MSDLNLSFNIDKNILIPRDKIKEYLGKLYDDMIKSEKYKFIQEVYTKEEYIEVCMKGLL